MLGRQNLGTHCVGDPAALRERRRGGGGGGQRVVHGHGHLLWRSVNGGESAGFRERTRPLEGPNPPPFTTIWERAAPSPPRIHPKPLPSPTFRRPTGGLGFPVAPGSAQPLWA